MVRHSSSRAWVGAVLAVVAAVAVPPAAWAQTPASSPHPGLVDGEAWIAFQRPVYERSMAHGVHLVRPDGSGAFFAGGAVPGGEQLHPDWSPDGRLLVLDATNTAGTQDLWLLDTTDWSADLLVPCVAPCLWVNEAAWSPDGARIAFQRHTQTDAGEASTVEILDRATGQLTTVFSTGPEVGLGAPRWSSDGQALVIEMPSFAGDDLTGVELGILDITTQPSSMRILVPSDVFPNNPDWSPDGSLIAFSAPAAGGEAGGALSDIWVIAPDGTGLRRITDVASSGGSAVQPDFTPDGTGIMFKLTDDRAGASDAIATIALDGTGMGPATGPGYLFGWHPRARPIRP